MGIVPADTFSGYGVQVASVVAGSFAEKRLTLQEGDIIIRGNDLNISNLDDLNKFKSSLEHGDRVAIRIKRGIRNNYNELVMVSRIPPPRNYLLFKRELPSAEVKAVYKDNHFDIQGSRVGVFRILVDPEMIDINKNIVVMFNGRKIFDDRITPDIAYTLHNFLSNRDRKLVFVNEVRLSPLVGP